MLKVGQSGSLTSRNTWSCKSGLVVRTISLLIVGREQKMSQRVSILQAGIIFQIWLSCFFHANRMTGEPSFTPPDFLSPRSTSKFEVILLAIRTQWYPSPISSLCVHRTDSSLLSGSYSVNKHCNTTQYFQNLYTQIDTLPDTEGSTIKFMHTSPI